MSTEILSGDSLDVDKSRGDAEECVDEWALADYVALGQPPNSPPAQLSATSRLSTKPDVVRGPFGDSARAG
jgi:hypothetical protein